MLVKSPFGRQFTDIADKLEQSFYCFGGDGGNDNGGSSAQNADMDKEMDAIDAEFSAMDAAYESGGSFTSEGVTTDSSTPNLSIIIPLTFDAISDILV